jgi:hypothetical protein
VGNSQSAGTECVTCTAGKAANAARTACTDLFDRTQGGLTDAGVVADILSTNVVLPRVSLDIDVDAGVLIDGSVKQRAFFSTMTVDIAAELRVGEDDIQFTAPRGVRRRAQNAPDAANLTEHASTYRRADLEQQTRNIQQESNRLAECLQNPESCDLTAVVYRLQQHTSRVQELLPVVTNSPRATRAAHAVANTTRRSLQTSGSFEIVIDNDDPAAAFTFLVAAVKNPDSGLMQKHPGIFSDSLGYTFTCTLGQYLPANSAVCQSCVASGLANSIPNAAKDACEPCGVRETPDPATSGSTCTCAKDAYDATKSQIRCYVMGEPYEATIGDPATRCMPCDDTAAPLDCVECQMGVVRMREGYSLSETQLAQGVDFASIVDQRAVYPCFENGTCTGDPLTPCDPATGSAGPL